jgi:hypothetical protein
MPLLSLFPTQMLEDLSKYVHSSNGDTSRHNRKGRIWLEYMLMNVTGSNQLQTPSWFYLVLSLIELVNHLCR